MLLNICLIFFSIIFSTQAFWWQPTTTETPSISVKHIPLTYFRTYTYQPLTGGPFTFPFSFGGAAQTPLLSENRYEHYTYPAAQQFYSGQFGPQQPSTTTSTTTTAPTTPTTTSTTTTTTTPTPTTPTTTSTTTTSATTSSPPKQFDSIINSGGGTYGPVPQYESSMYPTYNRRLYMSNLNSGGNYYRPHYPYPDYASMTKTSSVLPQQRPSHVQFVPCMCPVSVGVPSGLPIVGGGSAGMSLADPAHNLYMPQGRSNDASDDDSDMELPMDERDDDIAKGKKGGFSESVRKQITNDEALLSDDIQLLETNNIDNSYRKSKDLTASSTLSP